MLQEKAPQVASAHSQTRCQKLNSSLFESVLVDQTQSPRNRVRASHPRRSAGRTLGPTAQTRTKTCFSGSCSGRKITDVLFLGRWRGTNGSAINATSDHANKKLAVEARIARQPGPRTSLPIECHDPSIIAVLALHDRRFRTTITGRVPQCAPPPRGGGLGTDT